MVAVILGVLLVATTAQAQYGSEYGRDYGSEYGQMYRSPKPQPLYPTESERFQDWKDRELRRYEQNLPAIRQREGRQACDMIQGNDAARADCYRSLGGW